LALATNAKQAWFGTAEQGGPLHQPLFGKIAERLGFVTSLKAKVRPLAFKRKQAWF
jgi:hypothetical protein